MQQLESACHYPDIVLYQNTDLPEPVANLVAAHIRECRTCSYQAQSQVVVQRLMQRVELEPAPEGLHMRIMTKLTTISYQ